MDILGLKTISKVLYKYGLQCVCFSYTLLFSFISVLFLALAFSFSLTAFGSYGDYTNNLQSIGVSEGVINQNQPLYRNDVVRLLSTITCVDCLHPNKAMIEKYNAQRWKAFITIPGNNFDDVLYDNYYRNKENYYYCVAQAADRGAVNGYPRDVSPFCPGRFCGANLVKQGEVIQIIFNLKKQQTIERYTINWRQVQGWLADQNPNSLTAKNFTLVDRSVINSGAKACTQTNCPIVGSDQFDVYAKYCTWNLGECAMVDFKYIKQGQWPVAEINILMSEGVMNIAQADMIKPYDPATSQQLLQYLYKLNQSVSCSFDIDYDKDGVVNHQDNCPIVRNPTQMNSDGDRYGDVCDEDIDGDGALNPIGAVNDAGFIKPYVYARLGNQSGSISKFDNCPVLFNSAQTDIDGNGLGDTCQNLTAQGSGLAIIVTPKSSLLAPSLIEFVAVSSGGDCGSGYNRNMGNGQQANGKTVRATYNKAGAYEIGVIDCVSNIAYTTLVITDTGNNNNVGMQIMPDPMSGIDGFISVVKPEIKGQCDTVGWSVDESPASAIITKGAQAALLPIKTEGAHTIQAICFVGSNVKAVSQANISVVSDKQKNEKDAGMSSVLIADNLKPTVGQPVRFKTTLKGVDVKQVSSVLWEFGDGTELDGKSLNTIHIYLKAGVQIIHQTIVTVSGKQMTNIIQLDVQDNQEEGSPTLPNPNQDGPNTGLNPLAGPQAGLGFYANLRISPLVGTTKESFTFQLIPNTTKKINSLLRSFGDGATVNANAQGLTQKHTYKKAGVYGVSVLANLTDGTQASYGGQVTVNAIDPCLSFIQPSVSSSQHGLKCDLDKDKQPDLCDEDIDGDGVANPLGLVQFENPDCSLTGNNVNTSLLETPGLNDNGGNNDNCPFGVNSNQSNQDRDPYGDLCDPQPTISNNINQTDSDNDGIPNHLDNLPSVPLGSNNQIPANPIINATNSQILSSCTSCPCGFTQTLSPVAAGDIIYSTMEYEGGKIESNKFQVK